MTVSLQFPHDPDGEDAFDQKMDWYGELSVKYHLNGVWSDFSIIDFSVIPFPTATEVLYTDHWGDEVGPVTVALPKNPMWIDIWRAAGDAIRNSTDDHHVFIEGFVQEDNVLLLITGS